MRMSHSKPASDEKSFLEKASEACKLCQNFGTASCPAFKKAVNDDGLDPEKLKKEIDAIQDGQDLNECSNS